MPPFQGKAHVKRDDPLQWTWTLVGGRILKYSVDFHGRVSARGVMCGELTTEKINEYGAITVF